jgi:putative flippase GtrA
MNRAMMGQIVRYGLVGGGTTALQAAVYWLLADKAGFHPQSANFAGWVCALITGYFAHGAITFRGHGREKASMGRLLRFMTVSLFSYALNAFWVWLTVTWGGLPLWAPIPLMGGVTPAFVFVLNRQWVYR